jgi:TPR repeat protein
MHMKEIRVMVLSFLLAAHGLASGGTTSGETIGGDVAYKRGDYEAALQAWRPLAAQGNAGAQLNLGYMYDNGYGVQQDYGEAIKWYRLAAAQGSDRAQYNLGLMYDNGDGVTQDYVQAHMWYSIAGVAGETVPIRYRDYVAREMTSSQLARAEILAREWLQGHP